MDNLDDKNIKSIILFQSKYKFLKKEISKIEKRLTFFKDYLMSLVNNICFLRSYNILDQNNLSIKILEELKECKELINLFPENFLIKNLYANKITTTSLNFKLYKLNNMLFKVSNHISPLNINYILKLFYDDKWINNFDEEDLNMILFLSRFFNPICVWESDKHEEVVEFKKSSEKKKGISITRDIIDTLLNGNSGKISSIVIGGGNNNIPNFLKNISELIDKNKDDNIEIRKNHFKRIECISLLDRDKILLKKNPYGNSLVEDKLGACLFLRLDKKFMVIQGFFKDDMLGMSKTLSLVNKKFNLLRGKINYEVLVVPKEFKNNYIKTLNLRDIMVLSVEEIASDIRKKYLEFKGLQGKTLLSLINEFLLASKYRKIDILTLLLMSDEENQKLAFILFDVLKSKDKKGISDEIYLSLHYSIRCLLDKAKKDVAEDEEKLSKLSSSDIPYERRISMMKASEDTKTKAMNKLKSMKSNFQGDNKAQSWLDGLLKLPFGVFKENPILSFKDEFMARLKEKFPDEKINSEYTIDKFIKYCEEKDMEEDLVNEWKGYQKEKTQYLKDVRMTFDEAVYGHKDAKLQLERIFAQWINGETKGAILGLQGPPGTGKTSLAKRGLSKCLKDKDGNPRPFAFLPIGGSVNGSTLVGHNYTYVGSTWGRIADILITSKCMNPIIFIDEIDKVSHTEHGREIISILTHLTDLTQNDEFEDKYFSGIKLDLSKALIVFSFNDVSLIDPILRDRITIINTNPLNIHEKIIILKDYMLPEIYQEVGFDKSEIIFPDELMRFIIETYTNEAGVRKIKEKIYEIIRDINLKRFHDDTFELPHTVEKEYVKLLFEDKPKVRVKKIAPEPTVGLVNGLYATTSGIGGLTVIQVLKYPSDKMLDLTLTGKQGDVMKESVTYALKIAFSMLSKEEQDKVIADAHDKKAFGFHVHTPEAAVPKDGPSAGAAMTLALYSQLTNRRVNNKVAMTGEIDLCRNVTAIGGVGAKLNGAKRAGATKALIPMENKEDLDKLRREGISPEDDNFEVVFIETIEQVLEHALLDDPDSSSDDELSDDLLTMDFKK